MDKLMWPFRKLTVAQSEDRDWRRYRDQIACTLIQQGTRGYFPSVQDCFAWADAVVAERRAERAKWLAQPEIPADLSVPQDEHQTPTNTQVEEPS